jgi:hypothetical protein
MPLTDIFKYEIARINKSNKQDIEPVDIEAVELKSIERTGVIEIKAIKEIERRRAKEISKGREEIISGKKRPDKESTYQPELPVYIRILKMLIIDKSRLISKLYIIY